LTDGCNAAISFISKTTTASIVARLRCDATMGDFGVGQPVPREEDPYLVRGAGRYVDDVTLVGQTRAYVLRSPHAHARILSIDTQRAKVSPGVVLVLTGNDPALLALGLQRPWHPRKRRDGSPAFISPQPLLARERVRYIGDPVALVVAETLEQAKDAAELIEVDYETLPAVAATEAAIVPGAPAVWDECPDNIAFLHELGDKAAVEQAFASADHVIRHRMVISRLTTNPMEPRGCLAEYDLREDRTTLRCTVQVPHAMRRTLAEEIFKVPETKFRIIAENVGGGFGMKGALYPEYPLTALAAKLLGRPVKWMSDRSEGFLSDEHCRDNVSEAELALDKEGRFLGFRVRTYANIGAYHSSDRNAGPPTNNLGVLAGTYVLPAIHVEVNATLTNTMMTISGITAARAAPKPPMCWKPWSISRHANLRSIRPNCAGATLFRRMRCRTRRRWSTPTTAATSARISRTVWPSPTTTLLPRDAPPPSSAASCAASACRARWRRPMSGLSSAPNCASTRPAR
jgi:carbon-monoxide dehydrogenase large subunit